MFDTTKYEVECVKHGSVVVEAKSEDEALEFAQQLPDYAFSWESADEHEVINTKN